MAVDPAQRVADLETALGAGELRVESDGDVLHYRSTRELKDAIQYFKDQAALAAAPAGSTSSFGFSAPSYCRE